MLLALCLAGAGASAETVDLADPAHRDLWISHPVIGDVSYDAFVRSPANPIHVGAPPYEWPVNGSLFRDPASGHLYAYIGLYPKGYWPAGPCRLKHSRDGGATWEDLGIVLQGNKDLFDGDGKTGGATPDVTVVADEDGYHMVYDWAKPDNSDGGLGYAFARSPDGPWQRHPEPIHAQSRQRLIVPGNYQRVYAGALTKRKADWLVLASMSRPGNAGGTWAFVCMTAPKPEGPWAAPTFLRSPQRSEWFPQPVEFFPSFVHDGFVYAPLTSVAANRTYQLLLRAPIEDAHRPEGWAVHQAGSLFHAEPIAGEAMGIWGQAFSGLIDPAGILRVLYPSRRADGVGTINIASRPWSEPTRRGFWLSGPNAPALGLVARAFDTFELEADVTASGPWRVIWNHTAPLGPDRPTAGAVISPLSLTRMTSLRIHAQSWSVEQAGPAGAPSVLASGPFELAAGERRVTIVQTTDRARVRAGDRDLAEVPLPPGGCIGLLAEQGTCLHVSRFALLGERRNRSIALTALEGLLGAAQDGPQWTRKTDGFAFGEGYAGDFDGAEAKWSFHGTWAGLWSPKGPEYGQADVFLDGKRVARLRLRTDAPQPSSSVWASRILPRGPHTVRLVRTNGALPVDHLAFVP